MQRGRNRPKRPRTSGRGIAGPDGKEYQELYDCQAVVDSAQQVIPGDRATNHSSDKQQPMATVWDAIGDLSAPPEGVSDGSKGGPGAPGSYRTRQSCVR